MQRDQDPEVVMLNIHDVAQLLGRHKTTIRTRIRKGELEAETVRTNGGEAYRIPLFSLPKAAQERYAMQIEKQRAAERGEVAALANDNPAADEGLESPQPVSDDENAANWDSFSRLPDGIQKRAKDDLDAVQLYCELRKLGAKKQEAEKEVRDKFWVAPRTLRRLRAKIENQPSHAWLPLLAERPRGQKEPAEFTPEAWEWIKESWGIQSRPSLQSVYDRAGRMAPERGWVIPSYNAVRAQINGLPRWWKVYRRYGEKALYNLYPAIQRDYTTLRVHELWCADGHRSDVWCRWPGDEKPSRPIVMAWVDLRTRYFLGWRIAKTESADLVRLSFRAAAETCGAIPEAVLLDNGRGFASKLITGGTPTRFRFQVRDEDVPGVLTSLGVQVDWSKPGRGQSKPIESHWRVVADRVSRRPEFEGAYCGNRPENKPEEFGPKKAVSIELFQSVLAEEFESYHARPHRGHGMDGRSPRQMYDELIATAAVRQPAARQLDLCLLAAIRIRPEKKDMCFWLLGNRYWTERCHDLDPARSYVLRFDPDDAHKPIHLYDGDRYLFDVPILTRSGFRDLTAAKEHLRARTKTVKAQKKAAAANQEVIRTSPLRGLFDGLPAPGASSPEPLPPPKIVEPLRLGIADPAASDRPPAGEASGVVVPLRPVSANPETTQPVGTMTDDEWFAYLERQKIGAEKLRNRHKT